MKAKLRSEKESWGDDLIHCTMEEECMENRTPQDK